MERLIQYFKPKHYALKLNINKHTGKVFATAEIDGTPKQDAIKLHAKNLHIREIELNGAKTTWSLEDDVLSVTDGVADGVTASVAGDVAGGTPSAGGLQANAMGESATAGPAADSIPVISLSDKALKDTWTVSEEDGKFVVRGEKIEKFARRTDLGNYASLNRLRDIMKKMGIRAELTSRGAKDDSIIEIAGKEFTLVEEDW